MPKDASPSNEPISVQGAKRLLVEIHRDEEECEADQGFPRIDGYIVDRTLGKGAAGEVYLAYHKGSERPVALKLLHRRFGNSAADKRIWRELDILAALRLPSVPRILDYGVHEGRVYLATEFIDGAPLDRHCDDNLPALRDRVKLLVAVCEAVQSLHERGVIHRDLKPANILIDDSGAPAIIDLGIATLMAEDVMHTLTAEGAPIGTPAFMSPEQARGDRDSIATRSDVYSLGAMAYLVLTGATPHDTNTTIHEAVRRVAQDPPRGPRQLSVSLDRSLSAVLEKACSPLQQHRYASASALAVDLQRWLDGDAVEARPPGVWMRVVRLAGKHPIYTTSVIWILIAVCSLAFAKFTVWRIRQQPSHIVVADDSSELRLVSNSGQTLHTWPNAGESSELAGVLVPRHEAFGGGQVALTVTDSGRADDPTAGRLSVWSPDNLDRPLWTTPIDAPGIVAPDPGDRDWKSDEDSFPVVSFQALDIFDESPGDEILVKQIHHAHHPTCLRIYDFDGNVLWEWWHAGVLSSSSVYWHEGRKQIIFGGMYGHHSIEDLGHTIPFEFSGLKWPNVVGAITPVIGARIFPDWESPTPSDLTAHTDWYKVLLPPERAWEYSILEITLPDQPSLREALVKIVFHTIYEDMSGGGLHWLIDRNGEIVGDAVLSDQFKSAHPDDPEGYLRLGELDEWR